MTETGIAVKKPVSILKKSFNVEFKEFSTALLKGGLHAVQGEWKSVFEDGVDLAASVGLATNPGQVAWLLVYRALLRALAKLTKETLDFTNDSIQAKELGSKINEALEQCTLLVNEKFFDAPDRSSIITTALPVFEGWLNQQGIGENASKAISARLPAYFTLALHEEWLSAPSDYAKLRDHLDTPFTQANERTQRYALYCSWLIKQVDEPMLGEPFGLRKLFVAPRAYFSIPNNEIQENISGFSIDTQKRRLVICLQTYLDKWLTAAQQDDPIRLISGGPGSGKSSFAKVYASSLARRTDIDVLFIPLHHYEPSADMIDAVGKFVQLDGFLNHNPLMPDDRQKRVCVIFDGLDELAMQGKVAARTAQEFVREVQRKVSQLNQIKLRVQVLITGRELVMQASESDFRRQGQILHLLPYYISENERKKYDDVKGLLVSDQRNIWWQLYGSATGVAYNSMPDELKQPNLEEITAQPLLNYLVALSLRRGKLKFTKETNLNTIYADLLKAIYERGWSKHQHASIQGIEEKDFYRILEEIALATWHGDGRTTTVRDIRNHCTTSGAIKLLDKFQSQLQGDPHTKVTQLLTAFYFRKTGHDSAGEETFEFTHKSFGEYLTSRRILREIELIDRKLDARDSDLDEGWGEVEALYRWASVCGVTSIDDYLYRFIYDELRLKHFQDSSFVNRLQDKFSRLFGFMLREGMPLELKTPRTRFAEEQAQARNSEEALFICLNIFARLGEKVTKIDWLNEYSFGDWLMRTWKQAATYEELLLFKSLSHLDLTDCWLNSRYLWNADFTKSILVDANLVASDCRYANFTGADLTNAAFSDASLSGANFNDAECDGTYFVSVSLPLIGEELGYEGIIDGATFPLINAPNSRFSESDLRYGNFEGANLRGAVFQDSILKGANFRDADLTGADFSHADLEGADFSRAVLGDVNFEAANLTDAIFS